ncbi:ABC-type polar amino acid transport system ATPase subunit [Catenuloplanes nepalensis]|uniref:ABC-type polar amino acid transport system ATPase subunit n=1 Tax=Catenuloplanes nepalensis TaxID=587533 RepID=A0ABT9MX25_9ACTN|nr:ABC-type polar amino acid transport system ATPase subunit [Catenuloplanes nepalensis]
MTRDDDEVSFGEQLERDRLDRRPERTDETRVADFDAARQRRERARERALRRSTGAFPAVSEEQDQQPAEGTDGSLYDAPAPNSRGRRRSERDTESPSGGYARFATPESPPGGYARDEPESPSGGYARDETESPSGGYARFATRDEAVPAAPGPGADPYPRMPVDGIGVEPDSRLVDERPRRSRHAARAEPGDEPPARRSRRGRDELSDTAAGLVQSITTADQEAAYVPVPTQPALSCSGLRKSFRGGLVLQDLDLDVAEHEVVVLIGASGSGKSTLLRCINLLEEIDDGTILLDGEHITDPRTNPDTVRRRIGMVFQSYNLFPHMTVLQNITLAPERVHRRRRAEVEAEARTWLERVGLGDKAREYPDRLSGGQQQRVAIVRALVNSPRLLLLDEVTSALDPELVGEVLTMIKDLKTEGMTMILATHEMAFARQVADRVCFLDGGRILEQGPPEQVFGAPQHPRTRQFLRRIIEAGRL